MGLKIITSAPGTPLGILLAAAGVAAVATIALVLPIIDPDDQLGNVDLAIPAQGPPVEQRSWEFRGGDSWWSDWHYSIRYQIIREGKRMVVSADPTGVLAGQPTQLTMRAEDVLSHAPVSGEVWIDGTRVGSLNTPFTYTFSSSVFATAKAASYLDGSVLIYVRPRTLLLSVQPHPVPTGRPEQVTVSAEDADTHTPVSGSVIVNGAAIGLTNMPFTYTFRCRAVGPPQDRQVVCPQGVVSAVGYDVTPIGFGF